MLSYHFESFNFIFPKSLSKLTLIFLIIYNSYRYIKSEINWLAYLELSSFAEYQSPNHSD